MNFKTAMRFARQSVAGLAALAFAVLAFTGLRAAALGVQSFLRLGDGLRKARQVAVSFPMVFALREAIEKPAKRPGRSGHGRRSIKIRQRIAAATEGLIRVDHGGQLLLFGADQDDSGFHEVALSE